MRNWFIFSASERWREDDTEHEHYADSGGKSGGQKEKLAYTILAASLAYQFKLEWGRGAVQDVPVRGHRRGVRPGTRTSPTRFGLELFRRLGLQLLIVTPLQKIHVIEPYVSAVGFVDNPDERYSRLQTLTDRGVPGAADRPGRAREGDRPQRARALGGRELEVPPVAWTRPEDVRAALRRKWQSGALLTAFAEVPTGSRWASRCAARARARSAAASAKSRTGRRSGNGPGWVNCGSSTRRSAVGTSDPTSSRAGPGSTATTRRGELLGVLAEVRRFTELAEATRESCPRLVPWLGRRPMKRSSCRRCWEQVLGTVRWVDERQRPGMYLRQVDVPGVDSKFIEGTAGVLTELLDLQLDPDRVDAAAVDFSARYGFRRKPGYVRFRCADLSGAGFCGFSEMSVRLDELAAAPPGITRVYVVENEITYLAFPLAGVSW